MWALVVVGFVLIAWLLLKRARWAKQFWRLSGMYFIPRTRGWLAWRPILTVALLLLLTVMSVRLDVLLTYQSNGLYTALQQLDAPTFWKYIGIFGVLAAVNVVLVLITFYIGQAQIIHWRLWLNQRMVGDWLGGTAYHRMKFVSAQWTIPISAFSKTSRPTPTTRSPWLWARCPPRCLWSPSRSSCGRCPAHSLSSACTIPRAMVFLAYIYVIIATVLAFRIGRPLIRLNFLNELLTASYRYNLVRIRENSENIAFYRGEQVENTGLMGRFAAVIANTWAIVYPEPQVPGIQPGDQPDRGDLSR